MRQNRHFSAEVGCEEFEPRMNADERGSERQKIRMGASNQLGPSFIRVHPRLSAVQSLHARKRGSLNMDEQTGWTVVRERDCCLAINGQMRRNATKRDRFSSFSGAACVSCRAAGMQQIAQNSLQQREPCCTILRKERTRKDLGMQRLGNN